MSIQINIGDHVSPFSDLKPVPFRHQWGHQMGEGSRQGNRGKCESADKYFKSLPEKRSLTQLLLDRRIWINHAPHLYGTGVRLANEIGIGELAYIGAGRSC